MRNIRKLISIPVLAFFGLFTFSGSVFAAPPTLDELDLVDRVIDIINNYVFVFGALIAVIMIIYAGYMWMIAGGDPQKTKTAQGTLTWAVIGLIFLGIFKLILEVVIDFLDLT